VLSTDELWEVGADIGAAALGLDDAALAAIDAVFAPPRNASRLSLT
jgi:hypothetical protein